MYIKMANQVYGLNSTIMRCTNTYGRKINTALFTEYVITTMLKGGKVYIGAPDSIRDYMYIDDHVDAYVKAIENFGIKGEAFNFGIGLGKTNKEVAFMVADILGYDKGNIVIGRYPPDYPSRPPESDQPFIVLDSTKAHHMLGWKPQVSLEEGLKRSIAYWKNKV
jgi:nucleoside-diphosphate-sugar epimerase